MTDIVDRANELTFDTTKVEIGDLSSERKEQIESLNTRFDNADTQLANGEITKDQHRDIITDLTLEARAARENAPRVTPSFLGDLESVTNTRSNILGFSKVGSDSEDPDSISIKGSSDLRGREDRPEDKE